MALKLNKLDGSGRWRFCIAFPYEPLKAEFLQQITHFLTGSCEICAKNSRTHRERFIVPNVTVEM